MSKVQHKKIQMLFLITLFVTTVEPLLSVSHGTRALADKTKYG